MILSRKALFCVGVAMMSLLSSCATMFHRGPAEIRISGPDSMRVMTFDSVELGVAGRNRLQTVIPPRGTDSLVLEYKGKRHTAYLEKSFNANVWLNLIAYGWFGFGVDDIAQTWFDYRYMTAVPDSNNNLHLYTGSTEQKGPNSRLRLLLIGGELVSWPKVTGATSSPFVMPGGTGNLDFEFGAGVDLLNNIELFYRTRSSIFASYYYNYEPNSRGTHFSLEGADGVAIRMIRSRVFLEGSYNWATLRGYNYAYDPNGYYYNTYNDFTKQISMAGVALGFSGDLSYLSLEYMMELRPIVVDHVSYSARRLTVSYGVNLKL